MKRLGYYTVDELIKIAEPMIEIPNKISDATSPKDYLLKVQKKMEEYKKTIDAEMEQRAQKESDPAKRRDSVNVLNYVFKSNMNSAVEAQLKSSFLDEHIQKTSFTNCDKLDATFAEFCRTSKLWRDRLKGINQFTELKNLSPESKCVPVVLRYPIKIGDQAEQSCVDSGPINNLEKDIKQVTDQIKQ